MKKEEKGSLIIEATFVFPIMFFVLLFLIYMGNMFFMRSQVDAIVSESAVKAAAYCADPFLEQIGNSDSVPTTIENVQPYHSILGKDNASKVRNEMHQRLNKLGTGFFAGMGLKSININEFKKDSGLLSSTFIVDVSYSIKFPIRFLGSDSPTILKMNSREVVPITETGEFILNVDMAMDYFQSTGLQEKLEKLTEALKFKD